MTQDLQARIAELENEVDAWKEKAGHAFEDGIQLGRQPYELMLSALAEMTKVSRTGISIEFTDLGYRFMSRFRIDEAQPDFEEALHKAIHSHSQALNVERTAVARYIDYHNEAERRAASSRAQLEKAR